MVILTKLNEVYYNVDCDEYQANSLRNYLKCYSPGHKFDPRFKNHFWDGKISFFDIKKHTLPIGLLYKFKEWASSNNINYNIIGDSVVINISDDFIHKFYKIIFENSKCYPRYYQDHAIRKMLELKRGVIEYATNSGKSLVAYAVIRYLLGLNNRKIIIIVPNKQLVEQFKSEFIDPDKGYGWKSFDEYATIMYQDHEPDENKPLLITTYQSLMLRDDNFIKKYNSFIIDEAHGGKSKTLKEIAIKLDNADIRLGMTGTLPSIEEEKIVFERKNVENGKNNKSKYNKWTDTISCGLYTIFGYIGPKIAELKNHELIENGFSSEIKIVNIVLKYPEEVIKKIKSARNNKEYTFDFESNLVNNYYNRNNVFNLIFKNMPKEENTIVLCYKIDHLEKTYDYILNTFGKIFNIYLIHGETKVNDRISICNEMKQNGNSILVATYGTMSTGINLPRLHNAVLGSPYKSKIKVLQTIGRLLRKHETKTKAIIYDIVDDIRYLKKNYLEGQIGCWNDNYFYRQFDYRLEYYKSQKFDYESFSLKI